MASGPRPSARISQNQSHRNSCAFDTRFSAQDLWVAFDVFAPVHFCIRKLTVLKSDGKWRSRQLTQEILRLAQRHEGTPVPRSVFQFRQTGCGHRLPVALVLFVRNMKSDPTGEVTELGFQNMLCAADNKVTALARRNPPKNQHVLKVIEICVMSQSITKIRADGLIDLCRSIVALSH